MGTTKANPKKVSPLEEASSQLALSSLFCFGTALVAVALGVFSMQGLTISPVKAALGLTMSILFLFAWAYFYVPDLIKAVVHYNHVHQQQMSRPLTDDRLPGRK